jgi:hypothetical protein
MYSDMLQNELTKAGARTSRLSDYQTAQQARRTAMAGAYSDVTAGNMDRRLAGATLSAQLGQGAAATTADQIAAMQPVPSKYPPGIDPATGKPIVPRATQIRTAWGTAMPDIASAISRSWVGTGAAECR